MGHTHVYRGVPALITPDVGFPWKDLPSGTTICDLGGGVGYIGLDIARHNPGVHVVLQDLTDTVAQGEEFWKANAPDIVQEGRVQFVPVDFFKESPVAGCDYYYVSEEPLVKEK